jgi:dipeptidyl-peptidase-4
MKYSRLRFISVFIFCIAFIQNTYAPAQEKHEVTVEWIYGDEARKISAVPAFTWLNNDQALIYDSRNPEATRTFELLDPKTGKRTAALDMKNAVASLKTILGAEKTPDPLPWPAAFDGSGKYALYFFTNDIFILDLASATFSRITNTPEEEKSVNFSPDGKKLAYVRENNLFVYDLVQKKEKQLTTDGSSTVLNGTLSWVYWEEVFGRRDIGYWWSDDSKAIAYLQTDESQVSTMYYVDFKPYTPKVTTQRYPKVGEKNPSVKVGVAEIDLAKTTWIDFKEAPYEYIIRVKWLPDNQRVSVQTMNRAQTELDLFFADHSSGKIKHILKETDPAWVNETDDLYFLKDGKNFLWASERDGYEHLYRFSMDGNLVNQITKGNWSIRSAGGGVFWVHRAVVGIDESDNWIYFTALEKSSIEKHLYRIHPDGSGMQRLTKETGTHSVTFSPDGKFYFDRYSNISTLPSLTLCTSEGKPVSVLAAPRPELLAPFGIQYPELFTISTADGFPMPAQILKPKNMDPNKKYPVIIYVYGGPSAPQVSNSFEFANYFDNILLNKGYLVMRVDNRSATAISKKLENLILKHMSGDSELNDLLDAVKWMKAQPYIDPNRIGLWGWSGGGTFTLLAMTHSKEFKAGIAGAGVTDFRFYDTKFAEMTMKREEDNLEGYEKNSLVKKAKDLHGRLLMMHGTGDDNVHIQNTWAFADELIKANILFEMMIYPMRKHGFADRPAMIHRSNTMIDFWLRNL